MAKRPPRKLCCLATGRCDGSRPHFRGQLVPASCPRIPWLPAPLPQTPVFLSIVLKVGVSRAGPRNTGFLSIDSKFAVSRAGPRNTKFLSIDSKFAVSRAGPQTFHPVVCPRIRPGFPLGGALSRQVASRRIAHRIASHRIASHRIASFTHSSAHSASRRRAQSASQSRVPLPSCATSGARLARAAKLASSAARRSSGRRAKRLVTTAASARLRRCGKRADDLAIRLVNHVDDSCSAVIATSPQSVVGQHNHRVVRVVAVLAHERAVWSKLRDAV